MSLINYFLKADFIWFKILTIFFIRVVILETKVNLVGFINLLHIWAKTCSWFQSWKIADYRNAKKSEERWAGKRTDGEIYT